ncbi:tRNA (guanosine(37)-N1)-methyltransferase TrmD [bacterium]|nr:tRNA (guanosine(37)-N1)-methyltransferase TrmD [bacterium]
MLHFITLSVFPEIFESPLNCSIFKKAQQNEILKFTHFNIRDFSTNKHRKIDDTVYGGGAGMLLMPQPLFDAIDFIKKNYKIDKVIFFSPSGEVLNNSIVKHYASETDKTYLLLCGRYEGIDQRVVDSFVDIEISIGNYILSGGELAALVFIDSVGRFVEGVLGNEESLIEESLTDSLVEYPQYTKPADFRGLKVPEILLSGHHKNIAKWKKEKQIELTKTKRPELLSDQLR